jgi:transcriptional regulator with XRE-family HTH domain
MADDSPREDAWKKFGPELRRRREAIGLSAAAAAGRAGIGASTWTQVENGVASRKGRADPYPPTRSFIISAAPIVKWPINEALAYAGLRADYVAAEEPEEVAPSRVMAMWNRLTKQQQLALEWMIRLMLDKHATYDSPPPSTQVPPFSDATSASRTQL